MTNIAQVAALLMFLASVTHSAEIKGLPAMPSAKVLLEKIKKPEKAPNEYVNISVYNYSDGSFNVSEGTNRIDVRGYKLFADRFDYNLSGWAGNRSMSGDARAKFSQDPSSGYNLFGAGYSAYLDKFGSGWILSGSADGKSFHYTINRNFSDSYSVWDSGIDVRMDIRSYSATVSGRYDKQTVGPAQLGLLGIVAGILSQPKLRQTP